ncbi:MAG: GtrA family protein [Bacteroides sp.]|nr:GtrA family protein [Bacteroides sp.]MCM1095810.1 GtrA family protein [Terasakiella sp.]
MKKRAEAWRFAKYCIVGGMNTLVTLCVIYVCKSLLEMNLYVCNAAGYAAGLVNSFLWNRTWVFRSRGRRSTEATRFICGFALCYAVQLAVVAGLTSTPFGSTEYDLSVMTLTGYGIATLLGNAVYTVCNFIYNRMVTFRPAA